MDLHTAPRVQYAIERAVENEGVGAVVVDLGDVAFMDSTALSALMRSKDTLGQRGVSLRLAAPSQAVERITETRERCRNLQFLYVGHHNDQILVRNGLRVRTTPHRHMGSRS